MGAYEIHLTISATKSSAWSSLAAAGAALGAKCLVVELARGATPLQPMLTLAHHGSLTEARQAAETAAASPALAGQEVRRCKIEREISDRVPEQESAWNAHYYEWHGRLTVPPSARAELARLCQASGGHLSTNAQGQYGDRRFVTLREAGTEALLRDRVAVLSAALADRCWKFDKQRWEAVMFDSNLELDAGWLDV